MVALSVPQTSWSIMAWGCVSVMSITPSTSVALSVKAPFSSGSHAQRPLWEVSRAIAFPLT